MSCAGNLLKTNLSPFAHLVDRDAERWDNRDALDAPARGALREEILCAFNIGERAEMTFHGHRYQLTIRCAAGVHDIAVHRLPVVAT